jgi:hypothetical protein
MSASGAAHLKARFARAGPNIEEASTVTHYR